MWIRWLLVLFLLTGRYCDAAPEKQSVEITSAHPAAQLTGEWRFHTGDDPRWSFADFDDSGWEAMDLTPAADAHDGDVGITGYLPGWRARKHEGYQGYAWYRKRTSIVAAAGQEIALLAPNNVEDAYQIFCNGRFIGQTKDFSGKPPTVYSPKPQMFSLVPCEADGGDALISVRVWMGPQADRDGDAGGIHVAPALGEPQAIATMYRSQWMEITYGYIVDAVEPACFLLLAILAGLLARRPRTPGFHCWLCIALILTALVRGNQSFFAWFNWESLDTFMIAKYIVFLPSVMAAWAVAWLSWLNPPAKWKTAGIATVFCLAAAMAISAVIGADFGPFGEPLRWAMAALFFVMAVCTVVSKRSERFIVLVIMALVATGQFAGELSSLGVPGIWFPFGVGVSRTQFAYAALILCLGVSLVTNNMLRLDREKIRSNC